MVIVLIATRYQTLLDWILASSYRDIITIKVVKRKGPKVYLYVDTQLDFHDVVDLLKQTIIKNGGIMYVYEIYGIYNGMIDYNAYMSNTTKASMKYYQSVHKDISEQEMKEYQSHSL